MFRSIINYLEICSKVKSLKLFFMLPSPIHKNSSLVCVQLIKYNVNEAQVFVISVYYICIVMFNIIIEKGYEIGSLYQTDERNYLWREFERAHYSPG